MLHHKFLLPFTIKEFEEATLKFVKIDNDTGRTQVEMFIGSQERKHKPIIINVKINNSIGDNTLLGSIIEAHINRGAGAYVHGLSDKDYYYSISVDTHARMQDGWRKEIYKQAQDINLAAFEILPLHD